ncbi:MAG: hypothetical protein RBT49_04615 [Bacteroidales bacterium]|jgi:hypothetical protein|nr:hypothetical protein [Bacteroidales bacterium]
MNLQKVIKYNEEDSYIFYIDKNEEVDKLSQYQLLVRSKIVIKNGSLFISRLYSLEDVVDNFFNFQ